MNLPIHVAAIEHMSGMDMCSSPTKAGLNALLAAYCRSHWDTIPWKGEAPPDIPETDTAAVELYFDDHENDSLTTDCVSLELPDPAPLILHTFENNYDEDHHYRQFIQRGPDPMEAVSLCGERQTIRQFLEELHGELGLEDDPGPEVDWNEDPEFDGPRTTHNADLVARIAAGDIAGFLALAEGLAVKTVEVPVDHVCQTHFGEWAHDTINLSPP